jgi:hypothetical protein
MLQNGNTYFNQKVGIGTTVPGRKLTVTGNASGDANNLLLANENDTDGDSASIGFSMLSNNTYVKSGIFFKRTTTQGRGDLIFANNNEVNGNNVTLSDAKMTIQPSGNVGIGQTNPQFGLSMAQGTGDGNRIGWNDGAGDKRASIICSSSTDALHQAQTTHYSYNIIRRQVQLKYILNQQVVAQVLSFTQVAPEQLHQNLL